jgi:hypothetical protein
VNCTPTFCDGISDVMPPVTADQIFVSYMCIHDSKLCGLAYELG